MSMKKNYDSGDVPAMVIIPFPTYMYLGCLRMIFTSNPTPKTMEAGAMVCLLLHGYSPVAPFQVIPGYISLDQDSLRVFKDL